MASRRSEWMLRSRTRTLEATVTPASRAGSAVLTEGVYGTTAATGHSVGRQAQTKPAGAAKRVQGELVAVSNPRSKRPRLGLKQGMGGRVKRCKEAAGDAIVDSTGGGPLPFSSGVDRLVRACRDNGRSAGAGRRRQEVGSQCRGGGGQHRRGSSNSGGVRGIEGADAASSSRRATT